MANVSGILIRIVVPAPGTLSMSTWPPNLSTLVFTTSIPTPRPEILVTVFAVEKPGRKMSLILSLSSIFLASSGFRIPCDAAFSTIAPVFIPRPSSEMVMFTCPPSWEARTWIFPFAGFPAAIRSADVSIPWSTQLRDYMYNGIYQSLNNRFVQLDLTAFDKDLHFF